MRFAFAPQFPVFLCSLWGHFISLRGQLPPQFTLKKWPVLCWYAMWGMINASVLLVWFQTTWTLCKDSVQLVHTLSQNSIIFKWPKCSTWKANYRNFHKGASCLLLTSVIWLLTNMDWNWLPGHLQCSWKWNIVTVCAFIVRHVSFMRICDCYTFYIGYCHSFHIFQQSAHITYFSA